MGSAQNSQHSESNSNLSSFKKTFAFWLFQMFCACLYCIFRFSQHLTHNWALGCLKSSINTHSNLHLSIQPCLFGNTWPTQGTCNLPQGIQSTRQTTPWMGWHYRWFKDANHPITHVFQMGRRSETSSDETPKAGEEHANCTYKQGEGRNWNPNFRGERETY